MTETFWMDAKYDSKCCECENDIYEGDRIVYSPDEYKAYCKECGVEIAGDDPKLNG